MKNFFFIIMLLLCAAANAQINLQYSYPNLVHSFSVVRFGYAGDKYVSVDPNSDEINIYNMNLVLEKTIQTPGALSGASLYYISDDLFDLDSSVEYMAITYTGFPPVSNVNIVKEDGSILLEEDSTGIQSDNDPNLISEFHTVYPSVDGTKMILFKQNFGYHIYALPGNLPCHECSNGVFTGNFSPTDQNKNGSGLSNPYPNPTSNLTHIDYQLPDGINQGELVFYNTIGNEVKRFKVTSTFSFINVSANDLPSGTYYYNLQTSAGGSEGKKMVVIR